MIQYIAKPRRAIAEVVGSVFLPPDETSILEAYISPAVLTVLIEYPYVDRDHRSTYYNNLAMRHAFHDRDCVRLHLFTNQFAAIDRLTPETLPEFQKSYWGYIVLRDTRTKTIGRSYIHPHALVHRSTGFLTLQNEHAHIRGLEFSVLAYPWMEQDANISRCAHVTTWAIIRYFSQKYSFYPERTLHEVTELFDSQTRRKPSNGMTIPQMAEVFRETRFHPQVYVQEAFRDPQTFLRLVCTVIESGIPCVGIILIDGKPQHAVSLIGHGPLRSPAELSPAQPGTIVDSCSLYTYLIASDDNYLPYTQIVKGHNLRTNLHGNVYSSQDLYGIIVPYSEKMFLDAIWLHDTSLPAVQDHLLRLPNDRVYIRRCLLTSSRSFKRSIAHHCHGAAATAVLLSVEMPKFIWLVEYSSAEEFGKQLASHRVIVDSTAMNGDPLAFLAIQRPNELVINVAKTDRANPFQACTVDSGKLPLYTHNLEAA